LTGDNGFCYQPGWLPEDEADRVLSTLRMELDWRQLPVKMFGREIPQPRLTAWCADTGVRYAYSGLRFGARRWHPELKRLRRALELRTGGVFNSVLANAYRNGRDSMGWHADDEPELGQEPLIASLSLGSARRFLIRPTGGGRSRHLDLEHGSLLLMQGQSQHEWQHAIPKTSRTVGWRINLTFRRVC